MKFAISENIKKFYPTMEECRVNNNVVCTEEGCSKVFMSESNLNLHLAKTHKKSNLTPSETFNKQYFCPELGCTYNQDKFFKELKILRTHYMMKHSQDQFICETCQKIFPTKKTLSRHGEYCSVEFTCPTCSVSYPLYESLQTHCRRKKHDIPNKHQFKLDPLSDSDIPSSSHVFPKNLFRKSSSQSCGELQKQIDPDVQPTIGRRILPKPSYFIIFPNTKNCQESQTNNKVPKCRSKMTQVCHDLDLNRNTRQTQTGSLNKLLTVETQTIGDYNWLSKKSSFNDLSLKSSDTQTDIIQSKNSSSNTQFDEIENPILKNVETNSSSTQTGVKMNSNYSSSTHTHDSIYTDTSDLDLNVNMGSFEFDNCNMETQTDFIFEDVMFGCDYTSNMYTQTCDDILTEFSFNNIHTQTAIDDMLKSVESQTVMSRKRIDVGDRDKTHIETQTDAEFREMLEVINS